jgi:hypothetical protein
MAGGVNYDVISSNLFLPVGYTTNQLPDLLFTLFAQPFTTNDVGMTRIENDTTSANFIPFTAMMNDGIPEQIGFTASVVSTDRLTFLDSESDVFGHSPDLQGYRIDSLSLTLNSLSFTNPSSSETDASYSLTFSGDGAAIPEPSSACLVILGAVISLIMVLRRRWKLLHS